MEGRQFEDGRGAARKMRKQEGSASRGFGGKELYEEILATRWQFPARWDNYRHKASPCGTGSPRRSQPNGSK
eukprot:612848-Pleurochrysis_carterae.AAC.1